MEEMSNNRLIVITSALSLLTTATVAVAQADDDSGSLRLKRKSAHTSFMLSLINKDRQTAGAAPVQESAALSKLAQKYAEYLLRTGHFNHVDKEGRNPQQRALSMGVKADVAENLAYQMSSSESVNDLLKEAEKEMMAEPRGVFNHRHNITKPTHKFVGIGVAQADDTVILVQEFTEQQP